MKSIRFISLLIFFIALFFQSSLTAQEEKPASLLGWAHLSMTYVELGGVNRELGGAVYFFNEVFDKQAVDQLFSEAQAAWDTTAYYYLDALWNIYENKDLTAARASCYKAGKAFLNADAGQQFIMHHNGLSFEHINHLREYLDYDEHKSSELLGFDSGINKDVNDYMGYGIDKIELPAFPWPAPKPSTKIVLPSDYFANTQNLGEMNDRLLYALQRCQYDELSYFGLPQGFVLVTSLERFDEDNGQPYPGEERWNKSLVPSTFSMADYVKALFWGRKGYYRVIAFVFINQSFAASGEAPDEGVANNWISSGANDLPAVIKNHSSEGFKCTALVYEFELTDQCTNATFLKKAKKTARTHIERTGICKF